jgi:hypothetical protein
VIRRIRLRLVYSNDGGGLALLDDGRFSPARKAIGERTYLCKLAEKTDVVDLRRFGTLRGGKEECDG